MIFWAFKDSNEASLGLLRLQLVWDQTLAVNQEKILDYAFGFENIRGYVLDIGTRQATIYFASTDFMNDLSVGRLEITRRLREQIQQAVDRRGLGVTILNVDLLDTHPPLQDVALVVHQLVRLHDAVGDGVAVGRLTSLFLLPFPSDCFHHISCKSA